ncbi:sigma 54-interacting transcriptional regulator [Oxalobacter formigenes]|uniref:sigma 54-interacting transcriptional regulator n=1 Tax=Oxalobacter formigenes TaxID=847 RepID=UPI0022B03D79|nr:sigma 54-interacting transcriptional regulator [Oxalobacter formigenes]MCZ4061711.1 sigma 54-interacting transcriptional regulator [Oxalobacter formigenes]
MTAIHCNHDGLYNVEDSHDNDFFHFLVQLTDAVIAVGNIPYLAEETANRLHAFFGLDYISLEIVDQASFSLDAHSFTFDANNRPSYDTMSKSLHATLLGSALRKHEKILFNRDAIVSNAEKYPFIATLARQGLQVMLYLPLISAGKLMGTLAIGTFKPCHFTPEIMGLLNRVSARLALGLDVLITHEKSAEEIPVSPNESLISGQDNNHPHSVIGHSVAIQSILQQIDIVASSNATILLQGETGTGKGLIAQTIHNLSNRKNRDMVKMNCTAIPSELMESELFGHEKGAFTGALNRRIGHFEQADKSTLFMDEIGDMPLDLQPKLLSVLQEHQIRRLGGSVSIPIDVRYIAATNCDLVGKIEDKTFRSDLFYRLNVFPITVPPLRERPEDIPLLSRFFIRKFAKEMNRHITGIPSDTLALMTRLPWPGNIRELENVMERAVILTSGKTLNLTPESLLNYTSQNSPLSVQSPGRLDIPVSPIPQTDKDTIIRALEETEGKIGGKTGASARLGLKRTTLLARIKRLGINVDDFRKKQD